MIFRSAKSYLGCQTVAVVGLATVLLFAGCSRQSPAPANEAPAEAPGPEKQSAAPAEGSGPVADAGARARPVIGALAPDISFVNLSTGASEKLSDFRGKVVVIDFWASWCGPCQAPMSKMQTYKAKHPEFGENAVFVALSIDSTQGKAVQHLKAKGWDKTHNVWGKPDAAEAFEVEGIPAVFIVDTKGKIAETGHPNSMDIPAIVGRLLAAK